MANLKCDRCNQSFGPVDQLPYDEWAIVNDSLTSISKASLFSHIGTKAAVHKGEYGNCMFAIEKYIDDFGQMPLSDQALEGLHFGMAHVIDSYTKIHCAALKALRED